MRAKKKAGAEMGKAQVKLAVGFVVVVVGLVVVAVLLVVEVGVYSQINSFRTLLDGWINLEYEFLDST